MSAEKYFYATGRRKTSAARIFMKLGSGVITVNGKAIDQHLKRKTSQMIMLQPLELTSNTKKMDVKVTVKGGGESGQAGAIRMGLARALCLFDANLRGELKKAGLLTRDSRMVERKKYGMSGARKRYQYSKR